RGATMWSTNCPATPWARSRRTCCASASPTRSPAERHHDRAADPAVPNQAPGGVPMKPLHHLAAIVIACALPFGATQAETRITYKSAKTSSSYYQMGVQIAEAVKAGTQGAAIVTVEESQGSVQNVMEAAMRPGNYVFTSPPALVGSALAGTGPFKERPSPKFAEIRALFPIPSLTMHFVVRADSGIKDFAGLAGKKMLIGKGSFGANEGTKYLE